MAFCTKCGSEMPADSEFCAACGRPMLDLSQATTRGLQTGTTASRRDDLSIATTRDHAAGTPEETIVDPSQVDTRASGDAAAPAPAPVSRGILRPPSIGSGSGLSGSSLPGEHDERFLPGTMVDGRYRIVGLLGRGGMGEVYRADDLKLGQPVALKFLPANMAGAGDLLQRFLNEVRTALKVTHPSVCRVYDIGEVDGHHYISMEYVDGEDLKSLLRRVGRLPEDRALEIARQICAGLAAAHDQGILHRDLKPANIMVDGRGRARITDFGLAGLAAGISGTDIRSGTPGYMAPEQLAGKEVTVRSDVYALGLVLYELFTGKRAFNARGSTEMMRMQSESTPATPTSLVQGLDPAVERVILQCLDNDPAARPVSALAVSAALPGGDPLAAALAAGETPSPELVAAAGSTAGLPLWQGVLLGLGAALGLVVLLMTSGQVDIVQPVNPRLEPSVLVNKSQEILQLLGYVEEPADTSFGFAIVQKALDNLSKEGRGRDRQDRLAAGHPAIRMWYRQGRNSIIPFQAGRVLSSSSDPPRDRPGDVRLWLDMKGRLVFLGIIPEAAHEPEAPATAPDWEPLLKAAGFNAESLQPVPPEWTPNLQTDTRMAWEGPHPDYPQWTMRLEAGAFRGRVNYLNLIYPWDEPPAVVPEPARLAQRLNRMIDMLVYVVVLALGLILARRNHRLGRGDQKGAFRLAIAVMILNLVPWVLAAHHVLGAAELNLFTSRLALSCYQAVFIWVLYLALEPYFRQLWPRQMISWVRVLDGRWRDSLVGRDILVGVLLGMFIALGIDLYHLTPQWLGQPLPRLDIFAFTTEQLASLRSPRHALAVLVMSGSQALMTGFTLVTFLVLLSLLSMRTLGSMASPWIWRGLAVMAWLLITALMIQPGTVNVTLDWLVSLSILGVFAAVLVRYGFFSSLLGIAFMRVTSTLPLTLDLGAWWAKGSMLSILLIVGAVAWGIMAALGRRPAASGAPGQAVREMNA